MGSAFVRTVLLIGLGLVMERVSLGSTIVALPAGFYATAINGSGQIAGAGSDGQAYIYQQGSLTALPSLGGPAEAVAINDAGTVVGEVTDSTGFYAASWSGGQITILDSVTGLAFATAINASGQITGSHLVPGDPYFHAFLYSGGTGTDIDSEGYIQAHGINSSGQITGSSALASGFAGPAFLYSSGSLTDLGTLGGQSSTGYAINDAGQVVGVSDTGGDPYYEHAFSYSNGVMTDLGTLGGNSSAAYAVNRMGQIVGTTNTGEADVAFVYYGGIMYDLNSLLPANSGWIVTNAVGINDSGQIIGEGYYGGSSGPSYFLFDPGSDSATPEPSTWAMCCGILLFLLTRKALI